MNTWTKKWEALQDPPPDYGLPLHLKTPSLKTPSLTSIIEDMDLSEKASEYRTLLSQECETLVSSVSVSFFENGAISN